jgi:hypothetical protein
VTNSSETAKARLWGNKTVTPYEMVKGKLLPFTMKAMTERVTGKVASLAQVTNG